MRVVPSLPTVAVVGDQQSLPARAGDFLVHSQELDSNQEDGLRKEAMTQTG